jgi:hypothetical protein
MMMADGPIISSHKGNKGEAANANLNRKSTNLGAHKSQSRVEVSDRYRVEVSDKYRRERNDDG